MARSAVAPDPLLGRTLGGCRIERLLGRGGMGAVYYAIQTSLDRPVALKLLAPALGRDPAYLERFQREAKLLAQVNHPNIVQVHFLGHERRRAFIAMEYIDGPSLAAVIRDEGALPPRRACALIRQVAAALEAASARGIVHGDIRPGNILVLADGTAKLTDFGLARPARKAGAAPGRVLGTALYMSPEQIQDKPLDVRSDIYSLGVTLWECLAGRPPFLGETPMAVFLQQLHTPLPDVREIAPETPADIAALIARMTRKEAAERLSEPAQIVQILGEQFTRPSSSPAALLEGAPSRAQQYRDLVTALVDSSSDAIFAVTPDGRILSWNAGAERIFGYTRDEIVGRSVHVLAPPELSAESDALDERVRRGERIDHLETTRVRKDGRRIIVALTAAPIRDAAGRPIGTSRIVRDITEARLAEEARRSSEERFRALAESAVDPIVTADAAGLIRYLNRAAELAFGYRAEEVRGEPLTVLMPDRFHEAHNRGLLRHLQTGETRLIGRTVEVAGRRRDGSEFPVDISLASYKASGGTFFTAILRDVTDRKRAEEELRQLRAALEHASNAMAWFDVEGRHGTVTADYARLVGRTSGELANAPWEVTIPEGERERVATALGVMREQGQSEVETRLVRPEGSTVAARMTFLRSLDARGGFGGHVALVLRM